MGYVWCYSGKPSTAASTSAAGSTTSNFGTTGADLGAAACKRIKGARKQHGEEEERVSGRDYVGSIICRLSRFTSKLLSLSV